VVVHGRDAARGSAVIDSITAAGGKARFVAADLTDLAQLNDLVDRAGTVDVLVNNAGFSWFGPTADLDVATFDRLFAANVQAPYFLVGALAPKMAARGGGSIASMAGQIGLAGGAAYGATKATLALCSGHDRAQIASTPPWPRRTPVAVTSPVPSTRSVLISSSGRRACGSSSATAAAKSRSLS